MGFNKVKEIFTSLGKNKIFIFTYVIFNILVSIFCCIVSPIILYHFTTINVGAELITTLFSTDWVIFGILVAILAIFISLFQKKNEQEIQNLHLETTLLVCLTALGGLMLVATTISVFFNNEQLYGSLVFSSLYFLVLVFENYLFILLRLFFAKNN